MRKKGILLAVLACVALIVCVAMMGGIWQRGNHTEISETEIPEEARIVLKEYMDALKNGTEEAVAFAHFEDEFIRTAYLNTNDRLIDYKIESMEMINDRLVALTVLSKTRQSVRHGEDDFCLAYNFLIKIEDEWYFVNGVSHIPPEIRDGLDVNKYTYDDENIVDPDDVFIIDLEPAP